MQTWLAPAKLNLFLHITGRRDDGYHNLQTIFQFLDLTDEIGFEVNESGDVRHRQPVAGIDDNSELCVRAAKSLQEKTGCQKGVDITLIKNIPTGGGLGGGSSDAATTLIALNRLWQLDLSTDQLAEIGAGLGADIPVFIRGQAAWAEGIGDDLTPVEVAEPWYLLICPQVSISTEEIFSDPELTRDSPAITIRAFHEGSTRNDFEDRVRQRYPEVDQALKWMGQFGLPRMTGTGACVFMELESQEQGESLLTRLPDEFKGFVTKGLNRHPLYKQE